MTLVKSSNYFPTFPSLMNDFLKDDLFDWMNSNFSTTNTSIPAINVKEMNDEFAIEVAAPGMKKEDFRINVDKGMLTISSERKEEKNDTKNHGNYMRREFSYQSFQRSFSLPEAVVESDKITATYNNGILRISLPKKEEVKPKPAREIKIA